MKKKVKKKPSADRSKKQSSTTTKDEKEGKQFDFGGLPDRNLKKNLGC